MCLGWFFWYAAPRRTFTGGLLLELIFFPIQISGGRGLYLGIYNSFFHLGWVVDLVFLAPWLVCLLSCVYRHTFICFRLLACLLILGLFLPDWFCSTMGAAIRFIVEGLFSEDLSQESYLRRLHWHLFLCFRMFSFILIFGLGVQIGFAAQWMSLFDLL